MSDAPLTQLAFTMHATKGVYAVLLGAGASMGAQILDGQGGGPVQLRRVGGPQGRAYSADRSD